MLGGVAPDQHQLAPRIERQGLEHGQPPRRARPARPGPDESAGRATPSARSGRARTAGPRGIARSRSGPSSEPARPAIGAIRAAVPRRPGAAPPARAPARPQDCAPGRPPRRAPPEVAAAGRCDPAPTGGPASSGGARACRSVAGAAAGDRRRVRGARGEHAERGAQLSRQGRGIRAARHGHGAWPAADRPGTDGQEFRRPRRRPPRESGCRSPDC